MGNGNIDVGNESPTRKLRIDASLKAERQEKPSANPASLSGAMSQQGSEFRGNVSAPQKFVHLVGCREPKVRSSVKAGPYSNPVKR